MNSNNSLSYNLGGYLDYGFTNKLGIKTNVTFNKKELIFKDVYSSYTSFRVHQEK
jgi:hypothetical protein